MIDASLVIFIDLKEKFQNHHGLSDLSCRTRAHDKLYVIVIINQELITAAFKHDLSKDPLNLISPCKDASSQYLYRLLVNWEWLLSKVKPMSLKERYDLLFVSVQRCLFSKAHLYNVDH